MAYGKPKISATEIKKEVLQEVSDALDRNSDFGSENLSFYGYSCRFELNLILQARGPESVINVNGQSGRTQQLEPGETPQASRKEFIAAWLKNLEDHETEIDAAVIEDFMAHVPADEPEPQAQLVKTKGKKALGETKAKAV